MFFCVAVSYEKIVLFLDSCWERCSKPNPMKNIKLQQPTAKRRNPPNRIESPIHGYIPQVTITTCLLEYVSTENDFIDQLRNLRRV